MGRMPDKRQPGGDADHQLLADADVDEPIRVAAPRPREAGKADLGEHDGQSRIGVQELARDPREAIAHAVGSGGDGHAPFST